MPKYIISSEAFEPITLDCPGCSGDALKLALVPRAMQVVQRFYSSRRLCLLLLGHNPPPIVDHLGGQLS